MNAEPPWRNQDYPDCNLQRDTKFCINILRIICHLDHSLIYNNIIHYRNMYQTCYTYITLWFQCTYITNIFDGTKIISCCEKACENVTLVHYKIWIVTVWILINEKSSNVSTKCENISSLSHMNVFVNRLNTLSSSDFDSNNGMNNSSWKSFFY